MMLRWIATRELRAQQWAIGRQAARGLAGHSKWANIKHKKEKNDKQKAAVNTRMSRAITAAVNLGGKDTDPASNYHLDSAIRRATKAGVPNSVIEKAIKGASGRQESAGKLETVFYEGSGPGGTLFVVEALTDNRKRTAPEVRHAFSKHGGSVEANTASFAFDITGLMDVELRPDEDAEAVIEAAMDLGATDFVLPEEATDDSQAAAEAAEAAEAAGTAANEERTLQIFCEQSDLHRVAKALLAAGHQVANEHIARHPKMQVSVDDPEVATQLEGLVTALEELEDVAHVFHNLR